MKYDETVLRTYADEPTTTKTWTTTMDELFDGEEEQCIFCGCDAERHLIASEDDGWTIDEMHCRQCADELNTGQVICVMDFAMPQPPPLAPARSRPTPPDPSIQPMLAF